MSTSSDPGSAAGRRLSASAAIHLLVCIVFVILGIVVGWQRSLFPFGLDGEVTRLTAVEVEQPGVDDWVQFHIGDHRYPTINASLDCLGEGTTIEKPAWSRDATIDG